MLKVKAKLHFKIDIKAETQGNGESRKKMLVNEDRLRETKISLIVAIC
jgi:hypothetical protein